MFEVVFEANDIAACTIDTRSMKVRMDDGEKVPFSTPEEAMEIVRRWFDENPNPHRRRRPERSMGFLRIRLPEPGEHKGRNDI